MAGLDISSMAQFLNAFLDQRDKIKEQKRQQQMRQIVQQGVSSGQLVPTYKTGAEGTTMSATIPEPQETKLHNVPADTTVLRFDPTGQQQPESVYTSGPKVDPSAQRFNDARVNKINAEIEKIQQEINSPNLDDYTRRIKELDIERKQLEIERMQRQPVDKEAIKGIRKYQELAAKEGFQVNVNPSDPVETQVDTARRLYALGVESKERESREKSALEQNPPDYKESIINSLNAIQSGIDPNVVYQRVAAHYPQKSAELKRILLSTNKNNMNVILQWLNEE